jgi:DNA processing protein
MVAEGAPPGDEETAQRRERWRQRLGSVDVDRDLALAARVGARLVVPGDADWPTQVEVLGDERPLALWVRGPLPLAALHQSVAVVGARACTAYGEHVASTLSSALAERGLLVLSGGAFGIDAAAHRGALVVGAPTVAVLACGVDLAYPRAHEGLLRRIAEEGLVVSEYAPGTSVTRGRFLDRNRLLAALTCGTLLVEAGLRSGARSTVAHARRLHRPVLVVPGPVTSPASAGCHVELRRGDAVLVTDAGEVLDVLGELGRDAVADKREERRAPLDDLDAVGLRVWDAMPRSSPISVGALAAGAGLSVGELLGMLAEMAALGLVEPADGGWRRAATRRAASAGA